LQSFLPEFLRPDSATENEDSQDSMAEDMGMPTTSSSLEYSQRTSDEAKAVSDFINKNIRNSGCVDLMSKFIRVVAIHTETSGKWFHGLPHIYSQIFKRVKKHIQFPNIPMYVQFTFLNFSPFLQFYSCVIFLCLAQYEGKSFSMHCNKKFASLLVQTVRIGWNLS